ncbi:MAG: RNA pseudouridine synthase [Saprospiraceae bacterium]|nr:RNA pseudouridine synthase [Saprospiraceae bacterium]
MKKSNKDFADIKVIYDDADVLVVSKPGGMAVQAEGEDMLSYFARKKNWELNPVTRLDQPVSGLVLLARTAKATAFLSRQLTEGKIKKRYLAVVEGRFENQAQTISCNLIKKGNKAMVSGSGKNATMHVFRVDLMDRYSLLELECDTGRFHQIRAQLSHIGFPIRGDVKYGARRADKEGGIYLHCWKMSLQARDGSSLELECAPPPEKTLFYTVRAADFSTIP